MTKNDLIGRRFGWLVVEKIGPKVGTSRHIHYICKCDCGNTTRSLPSYRLLNGGVLSCGCMVIKHGHSVKDGTGWASPEYRSWDNMMKRCYNPKENGYHNYGGRGIKVCERWHDFRNFYHDLGPRPDGASLDRKETNGDYTPKNCRWATRWEQDRNRRGNKWLDCNGERRIITDWSIALGTDIHWIQRRLDRGYTMEQIVKFASYRSKK